MQSLIDEVTKLAQDLGIEMSLKANGATKEHLDTVVDELAYRAFEDQCTPANPKEPLVAELKEIIYDAFEGEVGYCRKNGIDVVAPAGAAAVTLAQPLDGTVEPAKVSTKADTAEIVDHIDPEVQRERGKA